MPWLAQQWQTMWSSEKRKREVTLEQNMSMPRRQKCHSLLGTLTWNKTQIWILRRKSKNSFWVLGSSGDYILTILQFSAWDTLVFLWEIRDIQCNTTNSQRTKMPIFLCMAAVTPILQTSGRCACICQAVLVGQHKCEHWERRREVDRQTSGYEIKGWTENQQLKLAKERP